MSKEPILYSGDMCVCVYIYIYIYIIYICIYKQWNFIQPEERMKSCHLRQYE